MSNSKKIPQASVRRDTRVSKPRNPESIVLPDDQGIVKDESARTRTATDIPGIDPRLAGTDIDLSLRLQDDPTSSGLFPSIRKKTPQESFEPSKISNLQDQSLSDIPNPQPQTPQIREPREELEIRDDLLFRTPPRFQPSVSEDGSPVSRPVAEQQPDTESTRPTSSNRNNPNFGNNFEQDSRRRAPPPVSFNPNRVSAEDQGQIPLAPGVGNLPREWQDLPQNFQNQLRRLLPIYYDITGPNANLVERLPFVPPPLFDDGEPNPSTEDLLSDKDQSLDTSQFEPPNRSKIDFLNLLLSLFNLILSLKADEIKGDDYEVVVFTKISDDEQRAERSESEWQATIREKEREIETPEGTVILGGRDVGDFTVGDPFPVVGSEVSVQEIETEELEIAGEEEIEVAVKVILSNGEEILKAEPKEEDSEGNGGESAGNGGEPDPGSEIDEAAGGEGAGDGTGTTGDTGFA